MHEPVKIQKILSGTSCARWPVVWFFKFRLKIKIKSNLRGCGCNKNNRELGYLILPVHSISPSKHTPKVILPEEKGLSKFLSSTPHWQHLKPIYIKSWGKESHNCSSCLTQSSIQWHFHTVLPPPHQYAQEIFFIEAWDNLPVLYI